MTALAAQENPHAGQGAVLLDIGGDVGALIVSMPAVTEGMEVEIRPTKPSHVGSSHGHGSDHGHGHGHAHHPHVAVVNRPVRDTYVASLVFPELAEGRYELFVKGTRDVRMTVEVRGGKVTTAAWPLDTDPH